MNSNGIKSCKVDHRMQGEIVLPENTVRFYKHRQVFIDFIFLVQDQAQLVHVMDSLSKEELDLDVEAYQRLLVTARSVAVARPSNLVKFAETGTSSKEEGENFEPNVKCQAGQLDYMVSSSYHSNHKQQ